MNKPIKFLISFTLLAISYQLSAMPQAHAACSKQNLTKCLDSVCAVNIGANPAARCQLCGTSDAGLPVDNGLKQVNLNSSAKYILSEKEVKALNDDLATRAGVGNLASARFVEAKTQCIARNDGCTMDDASDAYDKLIEQSCKAAGVSAQMAAAVTQLHGTAKTSDTCESEINACLLDDKRCGPGLLACKEDGDFDRNFSQCSLLSKGCEAFLADIRKSTMAARDNNLKNVVANAQKLAKSFQDARAQDLASAHDMCTNNAGRAACVKTICATNMPNNCTTGNEDETAMATLLCGFWDTACGRLK